MSDPRNVSNQSSDHKEWVDVPDSDGRSSDVLLGELRAQSRHLNERLDQAAIRFADRATGELGSTETLEVLAAQVVGEGAKHRTPQEDYRHRALLIGCGAFLVLGLALFLERQQTDRGQDHSAWSASDIGSRSLSAGIANIAVQDPTAWITDLEKVCNLHGVQLFRQDLEAGAVRLQVKVPHNNDALVKALAERGVRVPSNGQLSVVVIRLASQ